MNECWVMYDYYYYIGYDCCSIRFELYSPLQNRWPKSVVDILYILEGTSSRELASREYYMSTISPASEGLFASG